jgi:hypothetical protein
MIQDKDETPTYQQCLIMDGSPFKQLEDRCTYYDVHNG